MPALTTLIEAAYAQDASDLHLEGGLPPAFRIAGRLSVQPGPVSAAEVRAMAKEVAGPQGWERFLTGRSLDLSRSLAGVRCRINILQTRRGVGMAIRLLRPGVPGLAELNLHPSLAELAALPHGLVLVSGATGSGKSSTIAALVQEVNQTRAAHVLTLEEPVEHWHRPAKAFIRQREVGTDTPSFEQGLLDAMREDPDVIVVGEMRRAETMRLTLDAAETGHLVFTTVHSASVPEALHRIVSAFAPEARDAVQAQLAGSLVAVVCQRLVLRPELGIRVPECSILRMSDAARNVVRQGSMHRLDATLATGAGDGSFSLERYQRWLDGRSDLYVPPRRAPGPAADAPEPSPGLPRAPSPTHGPRRPAAPRPSPPPSGGPPVYVIEDEGADAASILSSLVGKTPS
jgi:twitching motility protein PilT